MNRQLLADLRTFVARLPEWAGPSATRDLVARADAALAAPPAPLPVVGVDLTRRSIEDAISCLTPITYDEPSLRVELCISDLHATLRRLSAPTPQEQPQPILAPAFAIGDRVQKVGGDYTYEGTVRAVVVKGGGAVRYVVEDARGMLFIFSATSLATYPGPVTK